MKKYFLLVLACALIAPMLMGAADSGASCNDTDSQVTYQQKQMLKEAQAQSGLPAMKNWTEKKLVKMLYELRDQANLQTYTYIIAEQTGKLVYVGRSIGYGIPYGTQYTAPNDFYGHPQAEPNGLFMPETAEGTWVMMVDPKGDVKPVYFEPRVVVSPFKLTQE